MTMLGRLRAMVAGDELYGLAGGAFEAEASRLSMDEKLRLRRATLARLDQLRREDEDARAADEADARAVAAEAADRGRALTIELGADVRRPKAEAVARRVSGMATELGLRSGQPVAARYCLEALSERAAKLAELVARDYRSAGEPAGLLAARKALSRAKAAEWTARREHEEGQRRWNAMRDPEAEAAVVAAHAAAVNAAAKVDALKRELSREWAVVI